MNTRIINGIEWEWQRWIPSDPEFYAEVRGVNDHTSVFSGHGRYEESEDGYYLVEVIDIETISICPNCEICSDHIAEHFGF